MTQNKNIQSTQKPQKQKKLNKQEKELIDLLFKFRHLNQSQIQHLSRHKSGERIRTRLNRLTQHQYLFRTYKYLPAFTDSKPSTYCLDTESKEYLRDKDIDEKFIKRLADEKTHSQQFREHCIFVATAYLSLQDFAKKNNLILRFHSKQDLYGMQYMIIPAPDCFFDLQEKNKHRKRYFLDTFDDNSFIKKRVYQYLYYYRKQYWQDSTKKKFPEVILVLPTKTTKENIFKFIQRRLIEDAPSFFLATKEDVQTKGMCAEILEKVEVLEN